MFFWISYRFPGLQRIMLLFGSLYYHEQQHFAEIFVSRDCPLKVPIVFAGTLLFQFQIEDAFKAARIEATEAYSEYVEEPKTSQRRRRFDLEMESDPVCFQFLQGIEGAPPVNTPLDNIQQHGSQQDEYEQGCRDRIAQNIPGF